MSTKKYLDYAGLVQVADKIKTRIEYVTELPSKGNVGLTVCYTGPSEYGKVRNHYYQLQGSPSIWVDITPVEGNKLFQWEQLPRPTAMYCAQLIQPQEPGSLVIINLATRISTSFSFYAGSFYRTVETGDSVLISTASQAIEYTQQYGEIITIGSTVTTALVIGGVQYTVFDSKLYYFDAISTYAVSQDNLDFSSYLSGEDAVDWGNKLVYAWEEVGGASLTPIPTAQIGAYFV